MKEPITAIAVAKDVIGHIMTPADFSALDKLIDSLGDKATVLKPEEKTAAMAVVDEWNNSVTERIKYNAFQADSVLQFLDNKTMYGSQIDEIIELFRGVLGDTPEYAAYQEALTAYADLCNNPPLEVPIDSAMTVAEADKTVMDNRAARLSYEREVRSAEYRYDKAVKAYIKAVNDLPDIKAVKAQLTSYKHKAKRMTAECQDKATRAKLNLSISDPDTRKLLHEMMDFTKTV